MDELETRIEDKSSRWQVSLRLNGEAVSGAGVMKMRMRVGTVPVRMGGIAGVWTAKTHRLKGYASRSMWEAISLLESRGYEMSILYGIGDFYHRYGYAVAFPSSWMEVETAALQKARGPCPDRMLKQADLADLIRLYNRCHAARSGMAVRSKGWKPEWRMPRMGENIERRPGRALGVFNGASRMTGYAVFDAQSGQLHVTEVGGTSPGAFESLAGALGRRAARAGAERVRCHVPADDPFGTFCIRYGCRWFVGHPYNAGAMGRIINLTGLMKKLLPEFSRRLAVSGVRWDKPLELRTDIGCVRLSATGDGIGLTPPGDGGAQKVEIPQMALTQLVMGYRPAADVAHEFGVRMPSRTLRVLDALFPTGYPYMWWSDRF